MIFVLSKIAGVSTEERYPCGVAVKITSHSDAKVSISGSFSVSVSSSRKPLKFPKISEYFCPAYDFDASTFIFASEWFNNILTISEPA